MMWTTNYKLNLLNYSYSNHGLTFLSLLYVVMLPFIPIVKRWLIINNFTKISYCLLTSNANKPQLHFWTLESLWYKFRLNFNCSYSVKYIGFFLIYGWCCVIKPLLIKAVAVTAHCWENVPSYLTMSDQDTWDLRDSHHGYRSKFWRWSNAPWLSPHSFQRVFHTRWPHHDTSYR